MSFASALKSVVTAGAVIGGVYLIYRKGTKMIERLHQDTKKRTDLTVERIDTVERLAERLKHELSAGELLTIDDARKAVAKPYLPELDMVLAQLDIIIARMVDESVVSTQHKQ